MADFVELPAATGTFRAATVLTGDRHFQLFRLDLGAGPVSGAVPIEGTVELGAASLAALETIQIGGAIDLSASSLAALESLTVGGTVDLSPASLAALEDITVGGTVELGATSLAALESITAAGPLTDTQLRASPAPARIASYAYPISTANSSTAQLPAGATFTGTWETPQDLPSISILLTSDQDTTITVQQAIDAAGTFRAPDIVFFVRAGEGFARSITINGNFVRLTAQNTGASTTTTFNLNVAFGSLGDADSSGTQPVTELPLVLTGQAAQTATVNNILTPTASAASLNVSGFRSASVQVVSTGTGGTFIFEQSNDGTNWRPLPVFNAELVTGVPITAAIAATVSQIIYTFPVRANFLRLRIATAITGGSIRAFTRLSTEPWTPAAQLVASNVAANLAATVSGTVTANIGTGSLAAGTNVVGDVGLQARANATGAASIHHIVSAATTNVAQIKATAGRVLGYCLSNTTASWRYVKLHNVASATPGAGVVMTIGIPPNSKSQNNLPVGIGFSTAISRSIVTGAADTDATATGVNDVVGDIFFA